MYEAMRDELLRIKTAYAALTPAGRLRRAQSVGRFPGSMGASTPGIASQVKPPGMGHALPGTKQEGKIE